jgi:DNA-binding response OmpR family regulator
MPARRVLVVEDDPAIRQGVVDALRFAGYEPLQAGTYAEALTLATRASYELLLLDQVLPGGSGLDVMTEARRSRPAVPVIVLTALGAEHDRVAGLTAGADDYVVKPFSVRELLARVDAVLRRSAERPLDLRVLAVPGGEVNFARREVAFTDGRRLELTDREAEVLRYLAASPGRAVSRDELLERVWRLSASGVSTRTIDMTVARLREKLGDGAEPRVVLTVRGTGYMLGAPGKP